MNEMRCRERGRLEADESDLKVMIDEAEAFFLWPCSVEHVFIPKHT